MAFRDFAYPQVVNDLKLVLRGANLFPELVDFPVRPEFAAVIHYGLDLALGIGNEKAKSEFVIAPVLLELRRAMGDSFMLFSGTVLDVDSTRGLNGVCDFLVTHSESPYILGAPYVAIFEAKNDLIQTGLGQCVAAMYAARLANEAAKTSRAFVYGVVSTGSLWKVLRLEGDVLTIDAPERMIGDLRQVMAVLRAVVSDEGRPRPPSPP